MRFWGSPCEPFFLFQPHVANKRTCLFRFHPSYPRVTALIGRPAEAAAAMMLNASEQIEHDYGTVG